MQSPGVQLIGLTNSRVRRCRHSTWSELRAALARPDPHHGHEAEDLRQALMFGKDVCRVVLARDFKEQELLRFDALLEPEVGCGKVAHTTEPLALANANGGSRVEVVEDGLHS